MPGVFGTKRVVAKTVQMKLSAETLRLVDEILEATGTTSKTNAVAAAVRIFHAIAVEGLVASYNNSLGGVRVKR